MLKLNVIFDGTSKFVTNNVYDELRVGAVRSATKILAQSVNIKGPEPTSRSS
jgi:hypothetical protein